MSKTNRIVGNVVCCALLALAISQSASAQDVLPNLEPFAASEVQLTDGGNTLRFSTTSWNRGAGPMELVGGDIIEPGTPEDPGSREVWQRIYQADGTSRLELVGAFEYHGGTHRHFHLEDYAFYTLQPIDAATGTERQSDKVSFCLLDNEKINTRLPNAPKKPVYSTCNPDVQGISVGWGDTYGYNLDGQSFDFTNNPTGVYLVTIEVNPVLADGTRHLIESNYTDNIACTLVRINREAFSVQVLDTTCNPTYGTVTVSSISDNQLRQGSQTTVTINGSGFGNGIDVHFSNGSGKVPVVSNVQVVDALTIEATVTVPTGGSLSDPVWDLNVGPAVLADAVTVTR